MHGLTAKAQCPSGHLTFFLYEKQSWKTKILVHNFELCWVQNRRGFWSSYLAPHKKLVQVWLGKNSIQVWLCFFRTFWELFWGSTSKLLPAALYMMYVCVRVDLRQKYVIFKCAFWVFICTAYFCCVKEDFAIQLIYL